MKEYPRLFEGLREEAEAQRFSQRVRDVNELLAGIGIYAPLHPVPVRLTCHDACHLVHGQGIREQPRQLLRQAPGVELIEMEGSELCCGSAGIYNLLQPKLASAALKRKVEAILATGAEAVVSANPGCTLWIAQGLAEAGNPLPIYHPVEILARALRPAPSDSSNLSDRHVALRA